MKGEGNLGFGLWVQGLGRRVSVFGLTVLGLF